MGFFDFFKRRKTVASNGSLPSILPSAEVDTCISLEEWTKEEKEELKQLRAQGKIWQKHFSRTLRNREFARNEEKQGNFEKAIGIYSKSIAKCEEEKILNYSNYAFDIGRVIILLSKTKQKEQLIAFLESVINKYPEADHVEKWKVRLSKIK